MLWCALFTERGTVLRFEDTLQDRSADAQRRLQCVDFLDLAKALSIEVAKFVPQLVSAFRNRSDTPPLTIADFKNGIDEPLGFKISFTNDDALVLIFYSGCSGFQLPDRHENAFEQVG